MSTDQEWLIPDGEVFCPRCGSYWTADKWAVFTGEHAVLLNDGPGLLCGWCNTRKPPEWFAAAPENLRPLWNNFLEAAHDNEQMDLALAVRGLAAIAALLAALKDGGYRIYKFDNRCTLKYWQEAVRDAAEDPMAQWRYELERREEARERVLLSPAQTSGDPKELLAVLQQLFRERGLSAKEWRTVGELLLQVGNKAQAVEAWRRAVAGDPYVGIQRKLTALEKDLVAGAAG